jgi:hypothetical protein
VVVAVELSRLLRRFLLVAALAAAGWLLSVVFAGSAGADEAPGQSQTSQSSGLLGGLVNGLTGALGGVTNTVSGITESLVDTSADAQQPAPAQDQAPIVDLPGLLPGSSSGSAATTREPLLDLTPDQPRAATPPVVTPQPPVVVAPPTPPEPVIPAPVVPPAPPTPPAPPAAADSGSPTSEQAGDGAPAPRPVKAPTTPANSGTTVSSSHDSSGGARHTHGVLPAQATLHPADAGFTTRSRAVDAAGRVAGLPASSPD